MAALSKDPPKDVDRMGAVAGEAVAEAVTKLRRAAKHSRVTRPTWSVTDVEKKGTCHEIAPINETKARPEKEERPKQDPKKWRTKRISVSTRETSKGQRMW